jgi:hypothetical protein
MTTARFAQTAANTYTHLRNGYPVANYNLKAVRDLFVDCGITCLILRPTGEVDTLAA